MPVDERVAQSVVDLAVSTFDLDSMASAAWGGQQHGHGHHQAVQEAAARLYVDMTGCLVRVV